MAVVCLNQECREEFPRRNVIWSSQNHSGLRLRQATNSVDSKNPLSKILVFDFGNTKQFKFLVENITNKVKVYEIMCILNWNLGVSLLLLRKFSKFYTILSYLTNKKSKQFS